MRRLWFWSNLSCSGVCSCVAGEFAWYVLLWNLLALGFSVGMEAFHELLSINVPWIQEFSDVLKIWS